MFWRSESPGATQASANTLITAAQARSTAVLSLPAGAAVTHAFLYWGANSLGGDATATFDRPGVFSQNVNATVTYLSANDSYQSVADVTSIVQANGPGTYRVSGVSSASFIDAANDNIFAGWWMVVLYELATDPPRNLALFDGLDLVGQNFPQNVNLDGFLVPPVFGTAKLGVITFEGDNAIPGDSFSFDGVQLSNGQNPATNFFNGTRSNFGNPVSVAGDLPQLTGTAQSMSGIDLDIVDITSTLTGGQTSAPVQATSTGDVYYLAGFVTSIPTFKPDFTTSQKTAVDVNGAPLLPGDVIEYTIVVTNTGNDTAVGTVLTDALPAQVSFVPGSLQITAGANAGVKTDGAMDDQCEFLAATKTVVCRLGTGATSAVGGQLAVGATTTVKLQVTVNAGAAGTISNQAVITAGGLQGAPPEDTPTDGNGPTSGAPPTEVVADQCVNDTQCAAPLPYCNTAPTPNVCVECLIDAHCPGTFPTCDPATNGCICVPSGNEVCDGLDNDCDGFVDEGFDVGMACVNGVGACANQGTTVCNAMGGAMCDAVPGEAAMEACDGIDNDCDGAADDGNPGGGVACVTGLPGACNDGATSCNGGAIECVPAVMPGQQAETCNDADDDCDGETDDGFDVGAMCTVGAGACEAMGTILCDAMGAAVCDAVPGQPSTEMCGDAVDSDCDGSPSNGCADDTDGDGLSDTDEEKIGTDPEDADSDDDGVPDGAEPGPGDDTDGDGLVNALDPDSDNDGLFDGTELGKDCANADTDPANGNCVPDGDMGLTTTDPLDADTDDGGISDGSEDANGNGVIDDGEGDPEDPADDTTINDEDEDGLSDDFEIRIGTNPGDADSDDDGVPDGEEPNPTDDTDGDGTINALDPDSDDDGLFDGTELGKDCEGPGTDAEAGNCLPDGDGGTTTTSPLDPDTDDGGIDDGDEDLDHDGVIDQGETDPNDPLDDFPNQGGNGGAGGGGGPSDINEVGGCACSLETPVRAPAGGIALLAAAAALTVRRRAGPGRAFDASARIRHCGRTPVAIQSSIELEAVLTRVVIQIDKLIAERGQWPALEEQRRTLEQVRAVTRQGPKLKALREKLRVASETITTEVPNNSPLHDDCWDMEDYVDYRA